MFRTYRALAAERGQGTVEYVALVLLVAGVFSAVVAAGKDFKGGNMVNKITNQVEKSIQTMK
jgi:hypothetical protein